MFLIRRTRVVRSPWLLPLHQLLQLQQSRTLPQLLSDLARSLPLRQVWREEGLVIHFAALQVAADHNNGNDLIVVVVNIIIIVR